MPPFGGRAATQAKEAGAGGGAGVARRKQVRLGTLAGHVRRLTRA